jgi:magnesium-protoporphyrin O-methyltransferase
MPCCSGPFHTIAERQFTTQKASKELRRYRRQKLVVTTRLLRDGIVRAGLNTGTLLDVGAGIGALTFELLDRGMRDAIIVEASPAYLAAGRDEAARRQRDGAVRSVAGDFLEVADTLPAANLVTLDRVVCCYPLYEPLFEAALRHAGNGFACSYPNDRWYVRAVMWLENAKRARKNGFQTFVHPPSHMQAIVERAGFELASRRSTLVWTMDVFVRRGTGQRHAK